MPITGNTRVAVDVRQYEASMFEECVDLLAESFIANPLHTRAFGKSVATRNQGFFSLGLRSFRGQRLVAIVDNKIVGFVHWVHSDKCQFTPLEKVSAMPAMVRGLGVKASLKVSQWLSSWERCDPKGEHLHLGPIAVAASMQGCGIGATLMEQYCREADRLNLRGYLETDKLENVSFYQRFDFSTLQEARVIGVKNYFMVRSPRASSTALQG